MIKLICSDIDGTLLDKNRELSKRTKDVLIKAKDDHPIVFISSRMPAAMRHLQAEVHITDHPLIAYNGGLIIDQNNESNQVLLSIDISTHITQSILEFTTATDIHISLYHDDEWFVPSMDYWAKREQNNTKVDPTVGNLHEICDRWESENKGAHKIMCMGPAEEIKQLYNTLVEKYDDTLHIYRSKDTYLEIANKKISKLSALAFLLNEKYQNINLENVIAFGDNYNDQEMIAGVGYGVAVDNAREEVKAVADQITADHKEDGVAIILEKIIETKKTPAN